MKKFYQKYSVLIFGTVLAVLVATGATVYVHANAIQFVPAAFNGALQATSSLVYMTAGTSTTTPFYNSYRRTQNDTANDPTAALRGEVLVMVQATTGVPTLNLACEISNDNLDYYPVDCYPTATTTQTAQLNTPPATFSWLVSTSTNACAVGGAPATTTITNTLCQRAFPVTFPTQYFRIVGTLASTTAVAERKGSDSANVKIQILPVKELQSGR